MTAIELRARPVRRLEWRRAQVREVIVETSRVKSLRLQVDGWQGDLPGQHVDIRLTAEDRGEFVTDVGVENDDSYLLEESSGDNSNCGGRSAATSYGPSPSAALSVS